MLPSFSAISTFPQTGAIQHRPGEPPCSTRIISEKSCTCVLARSL